jgi:hypothetical protein
VTALWWSVAALCYLAGYAVALRLAYRYRRRTGRSPGSARDEAISDAVAWPLLLVVLPFLAVNRWATAEPADLATRIADLEAELHNLDD